MFDKVLGVFCGILVCTCEVFAAGKTKKSRFDIDRAHVLFDVQKSPDGLRLVGAELGEVKFELLVPDSSFGSVMSSGFREGCNFNLSRLDDFLLFQYRGTADSNEAFDVKVSRNGDVEFVEADRYTYTGWDKVRTYGIRTFGTIENREQLAFSCLITKASAFYNSGTIRALYAYFYGAYLFNSGVIDLGETPDGIADLRDPDAQRPDVVRSRSGGYRLENRGLLISRTPFEVVNMSYHECSTGIVNSLNVSNGNIMVHSGGGLKIAGIISGQISKIAVEKNASLFAATDIRDMGSNVLSVDNLDISEHGLFHFVGSPSLSVANSFSNLGVLSSGNNMTLALKRAPTSTNQKGKIIVRNSLELSYIIEEDDQLDPISGIPLLCALLATRGRIKILASNGDPIRNEALDPANPNGRQLRDLDVLADACQQRADLQVQEAKKKSSVIVSGADEEFRLEFKRVFSHLKNPDQAFLDNAYVCSALWWREPPRTVRRRQNYGDWLGRALKETRLRVHDRVRWLSSGGRRFFDDVVIPLALLKYNLPPGGRNSGLEGLEQTLTELWRKIRDATSSACGVESLVILDDIVNQFGLSYIT
ncbi:MAG: hypothetical protein LBC25_01525 [Holosporales bacterium]|nr:hypothetical protein [Holosporales bacterium]